MGNSGNNGLTTPILLKMAEDMGWPKDKRMFYLLTADGLFICRDHPFFRSCVLARGWPSELAHHKESLRVTYPKVPRRLLELCVGFFSRIAKQSSAEAAAVLLWDTRDRCVRVMVPDQVSKCCRTYSGSLYGLSVHYEMPVLPGHLMIIGDIHSHVDGRAYASYADRYDEVYRAGLHIVCGRLDREPPEFHVDAVVDGVRFTVDSERVLEGYRRRRTDVPADWLRRVKIEIDDPYRRPAKTSYGRRDGESTCGALSSSSYIDRHYGDTAVAGSDKVSGTLRHRVPDTFSEPAGTGANYGSSGYYGSSACSGSLLSSQAGTPTHGGCAAAKDNEKTPGTKLPATQVSRYQPDTGADSPGSQEARKPAHDPAHEDTAGGEPDNHHGEPDNPRGGRAASGGCSSNKTDPPTQEQGAQDAPQDSRP